MTEPIKTMCLICGQNSNELIPIQNMKPLSGHRAIQAKLQDPTMYLCKYADPIEDYREDLTLDEAIEIAKSDPGLIYAKLP